MNYSNKVNELEDFIKEYNLIDEVDLKLGNTCYRKKEEVRMIRKIFEKFTEEVYGMNKVQKKVCRLKNEIKIDMRKKYSQEDMELIEQLQRCEDIESRNLIEQAFIYGYVISAKIDCERDSNNKELHKRKNLNLVELVKDTSEIDMGKPSILNRMYDEYWINEMEESEEIKKVRYDCIEKMSLITMKIDSDVMKDVNEMINLLEEIEYEASKNNFIEGFRSCSKMLSELN